MAAEVAAYNSKAFVLAFNNNTIETGNVIRANVICLGTPVIYYGILDGVTQSQTPEIRFKPLFLVKENSQVAVAPSDSPVLFSVHTNQVKTIELIAKKFIPSDWSAESVQMQRFLQDNEEGSVVSIESAETCVIQ